jgi:hypothetical protein
MARQLSFAERMGITPPKGVQINGIDADLRTGLWNAVRSYWARVVHHTYRGAIRSRVWATFLKKPIDDLPYDTSETYTDAKFWSEVRDWYFDKTRQWFELYGFIEHVGQVTFDDQAAAHFVKLVNDVLENENAGFRYINRQIAPITNADEIQTVQRAVKPLTTPLKLVSDHIQQALVLMSDKTNPDYRNSMKESISAVESLCKLVAKMPAATLGPALEKTAKELDLNDFLRDGMKAIYKYTSDDHGIRHGLKDDDQPEQEDARFMLVTCSAFVNMVTEKARKQGKLPA